MSKKSHHFLTLWPWSLTYDLEKLSRSGHYHYQCVYQIWEQSIPWFLSSRVNTIAGGGRRVAGGGRLRRKTITSFGYGGYKNLYIPKKMDIWNNHSCKKCMICPVLFFLSFKNQINPSCCIIIYQAWYISNVLWTLDKNVNFEINSTCSLRASKTRSFSNSCSSFSCIFLWRSSRFNANCSSRNSTLKQLHTSQFFIFHSKWWSRVQEKFDNDSWLIQSTPYIDWTIEKSWWNEG